MEEGKILSQPKHPGKEYATMKAALIVAPREIEIVETPVPEPADDEVRIRVEGSGICGSDLPVWEGRSWFEYPRLPGSPGHEGYGIIDAIGKKVIGFTEGDRVAMLSYHAYAQFDVAKADQVVKLPDFLKNQPFPAEPLGCAMNIFDRADIHPNDFVVVIGAGFIGNLLIQLCKSTGATVVAISRRETALKMAFDSGADHIVKLDNHCAIVQKIQRLTMGQGSSRVFEVTGKQWPLDLAGDIVGTRGKIIIAGFHQDGLRQINMQNWNWKGIDVINAHERDPKQYVSGMQRAIEAVRDGKMNPMPLYSTPFSLEQLNTAFEKMSTREEGYLKLLMKI